MGRNRRISRNDLFFKYPSQENEQTGDRSLKAAINTFKAHFIEKVLEENNWNQTETARVLDIQRTYLSRLIKELAINSKEQR
jgi:Nif-specific regulatory protein